MPIMRYDSDPEILDLWSSDKTKMGQGKGEEYLANENILFADEMKNGEGKEENIWRGKIFFCVL